jgi:hypothetical protein
MKVFLIISTVIALALATSGLWQMRHPPYSDAQIAASIVDTWQPRALVTALVLAVLCLCACAIVAIRILTGRRLRRLSYVALLSICAAFGAQLGSHIALTHQATRVTGQTFGPLYGLL